jgi:hypothetical protein
MPNITVYLPDDVAAAARRAAKAERVTTSRWVSSLIARRVASTAAPGVRKAAGAIPDFPSAEEIRSGYGPDVKREGLA